MKGVSKSKRIEKPKNRGTLTYHLTKLINTLEIFNSIYSFHSQRLREEEERKNRILATASKTTSPIDIAVGALAAADRLKTKVVPPKTYITPQIDDQGAASFKNRYIALLVDHKCVK